MSERRSHPQSFEELPEAKIERNWKTIFIWLIPIGAAALAGWFIYSEMIKSGPTLHVYFEDAAGIERGKSPVKYRGAEIGQVKDVQLTKDRKRVDITVSLDKSAEDVAREGSRFWIVQPELGAEQIRGLRTIVSGDYIAVEPGDGPQKTEFTGFPKEPVIESPGSLRIVLLAEKTGSIKERTPIYYRGVQVGQVLGSELGKASQTIEITADIQRRYKRLVRLNSRFWNSGGVRATISLSGISIAAQSTEALLSGGISFATPDAVESEAPPGTSFRLYDKPEDAWLDWSPAIELESNPPTNATPEVISPK